jgi:predicted CoA-binding protein
MSVQHASLEVISEFLAQRRIAMVGVSREEQSLSMKLFAEMCRLGYDMVPVNPNTAEIGGKVCFARVQDIHPEVDAALLMTSAEVTERVVVDCAAAGVGRIWMYRGAGQGAVNQRAVEFCEELDIQVIPGECPFMFLSKTGLFHQLHGVVRKISGRYPRHEATAATHDGTTRCDSHHRSR